MAIQVSERLSFPAAEALLNMMGTEARPALYRALDKPDSDIKVTGRSQTYVRYFDQDRNFTVTFR